MIKEYVLKALRHWRILLKDRAFFWSLVIGVVVMGIALFVNLTASAYDDKFIYNSVGDLILDHIPTYNLEFLFLWGAYGLMLLIAAYGFFNEPEKVPFALKTFGLLFLVRSFFIMLTNIGPPNGFFFAGDKMLDLEKNVFEDWIFRNDLFFSGHVAAPFLAYLLFQKSTWFKWTMLIGSIVMGATVLLMHVHYSIDVFAAFFITYGIFAFSNKIFNQLILRFQRRLEQYGLPGFLGKG